MDIDLFALLVLAVVIGPLVVWGLVRRTGPGTDRDRVLVFRVGSCLQIDSAHLCLSVACAHTEAPIFFIVDLSAVECIDEHALLCLRSLHERCRRRRCGLILAGLGGGALDRIERAGLDTEVGRNRIFQDIHSARAWLASQRSHSA